MHALGRRFCIWATAFLVTTAVVAGEPAVTSHHTLWKVEGPHNTIYLLGSIHLLKKSDYPLAPVIESAFSNAQVVAFETDIGQVAQASAAILTQCLLPAGETIQDEISPKTYALLSNYLSSAGVPVATVSQMKPGFAAFLLEAVESQKLGLDPQYGLDETFFAQARAAGKTIVPLEPVDFQIKLLTTFSKEEGNLILQSTLADMTNTDTEFDQMVGAWKTGDSATLNKLLTEAFDDSPAIYKRLVTDRTARWLPEVEQLLDARKPAIVIVGAGHVIGDKGLVALLRKKGYKITQL